MRTILVKLNVCVNTTQSVFDWCFDGKKLGSIGILYIISQLYFSFKLFYNFVKQDVL